MKQKTLWNLVKLGEKEFGGSLLKGNPREARPVSVKKPMHLVMRSTMAVGSLSFLNSKNSKRIEKLVRQMAEAKRVKLYRYANSGNHLHMIVLPSSRKSFRDFIRAITGLIARLVLGAERGHAVGQKFWDARPYTKILELG